MKEIFKKCKESWNHIPYTFMHWIAFHKVKKQLGYSGYWFHDWDKLAVFILMPWKGDRWVNKWHRENRSHHPGNKTGKVDWTEAIIDWECARFTKPDKPLNARQTWEKYYSEYPEAEEYLNKMGL